MYIDECKRMNIQILKPDINKSFTRFTVDNGKIRFGLGSIKNVGVQVVDCIVANREKLGEFQSFSDFCERMENESVNKKCIESLIKAGAFDEFEQTRSTLMASFESIIDSILDTSKKSLKGQITMFDLGSDLTEDENDIEKMKYTYTTLKEYSEKELLSMEKEMLGLYISGHPLEGLRQEIASKTTINSMQMRETAENEESNEVPIYRDGQNVKYAGIISSVKKKYTKTNKLMAFITIEDLYGSAEIICFENCYQSSSDILVEDNVVLVEGRLSIREDEETKIVANSIKEFSAEKNKSLNLDITNLEENKKEYLRGALRFFSGEKNNIQVYIKNGERKDAAGGIFLNDKIIKEFEEILGKEKVKIE
jgi:DNA polymerase-3 subunit alpha